MGIRVRRFSDRIKVWETSGDYSRRRSLDKQTDRRTTGKIPEQGRSSTLNFSDELEILKSSSLNAGKIIELSARDAENFLAAIEKFQHFHETHESIQVSCHEVTDPVEIRKIFD